MAADRRSIRRILAVKPSSLGDIFHLFPSLTLLHRLLPEAELDFLINPSFAPLLDYSPFPVSRKLLFDRRYLGTGKGFFCGVPALIRELRQVRYDLAIDFQGLMRSAFFARLSGADRVLGFRRTREPAATWLYTDRRKIPFTHAVERNVNLLNAWFGTREKPELELLRSQPAARASLLTKCGGALPEKYCVIVPGARWESKKFPASLFAEVIQRVHARCPECRFVISGSPEETVQEAAIAGLLNPDFPLLRLAGKTGMAEMMELMLSAAAVLSNDSGPLHAAVACGVPAFAFYGATDPALTGPYRGKVYRVPDVACAPCLQRQCRWSGTPPCFHIDPEPVAADVAAAMMIHKEEKL